MTLLKGGQDRELARTQAENARILEMIKTGGDPDTAAVNLEFLIDAGLVTSPDTVERLTAFLEAREPGTGPSLGNPVARPTGIVGLDDAVPTSDPSMAQAAIFGASVGQVFRTDDDMPICTAFLASSDTVILAAACANSLTVADNRVFGDFRLSTGELAGANVALDRIVSGFADDDFYGGYSVVSLIEKVGAEGLPMSAVAPQPGSRLGIVYYREASEQLAVWGGRVCSVTEVTDNAIVHNCDTGVGSLGAPVIDISKNTVVGIHMIRDLNERGVAMRIRED